MSKTTRQLVAQIQVEKDQGRLIQLVKELNNLLEPTERGREIPPKPRPNTGAILLTATWAFGELNSD